MPSFDTVSKINMQEVDNAVNQAVKEIGQRYDFKNSKSEIKLEKDVINVISDDDYKLKSVIDVLQSKLVKRGISLKSLEYGKVEPATGGTVRQVVKLKQGVSVENAKEIVKIIKDSKLKVQAAIHGDLVRVSGKNRDDLQDVIKLLRRQNLPLELQFENFRD